MAISRDQLPALELPTKSVEVPSLGGEVICRGMDMPQLLRFSSLRSRLLNPLDEENQDQAVQRAGGELLPVVLGMCVVLDDGQPAYTEAQWRVFGGMHSDEAVTLFNTVMLLSGQDSSAEKKA
jgi:hypothetical protein